MLTKSDVLRLLREAGSAKNLDLSGRHFVEGIDLFGIKLIRVNLREANLREANLRGANLRGADLRGANLSGAKLGWANLTDADLRRAALRGADLTKADFTRANLEEADLRWAKVLDRVRFPRREFLIHTFVVTRLDCTHSKVMTLDKARSLRNTKLYGFRGLTKEQLQTCKGKGANFEDSSSEQPA